MGNRAAKTALYAEFAAVAKGIAHGSRLELVDLLAQGPRSVESLAKAANLSVTSCSAHLQTMREAGLVTSRRHGKRVIYSLSSDEVTALWDAVRRVAIRHRPHTERAKRDYLGPQDTVGLAREEMLRRVADGTAILLDVRPDVEYAAGHLPGARNIPVNQLLDRIGELPEGQEIVAYCRGEYCVFSHEAARLLQQRGRSASHLEDGLVEWRLAGLPIETDRVEPDEDTR